MNATISVRELAMLRESGQPFVLIDTHPPEYFQQYRLPGACNACVYEMVFLQTVAGLVPDKNQLIVVYGSSARSKAGAVARQKLIDAGYTNVRELAGGLEGCRDASEGILPEGMPLTDPILHDGIYTVDTSASRVEWTGRNINNRHYGVVSLGEGEVKIAGGLPVSGRATVDMNSLVNLDLKDEIYNRMLITHLKSDDFFDVACFPFARFYLDGVEPIPDAAAGSPSVTVTGRFELKGQQLPLVFPVELAPQEDGSIKFHAILDLDRTRWGVLYGSGRFFERLGMHLVSDYISLELFLVARPKA